MSLLTVLVQDLRSCVQRPGDWQLEQKWANPAREEGKVVPLAQAKLTGLCSYGSKWKIVGTSEPRGVTEKLLKM